MRKQYPHFKGMMPILPTFVDAFGEPDLKAQGRVVEYLIDSGAVAIGHMGGASEYAKVSEYDRDPILRTLSEQVAGRVPIFIGTTDYTRKTSLKRAEAARDQGASMIMVCSPPAGVLTRADLIRYYEDVGKATDLPIIVQDTGASYAHYTADTLLEIHERGETGGYNKLDGIDCLPKTPRLREAFGDGVQIIGGSAGYAMPTMLRLGITAFMTGTECADVHNDVIQTYFAGDEKKADMLYHMTVLSYLYFYNQNSRYFLKYMLKRRGLIDAVYLPCPNENGEPDPFIIAELDRTLDRINDLRGKNVL